MCSSPPVALTVARSTMQLQVTQFASSDPLNHSEQVLNNLRAIRNPMMTVGSVIYIYIHVMIAKVQFAVRRVSCESCSRHAGGPGVSKCITVEKTASTNCVTLALVFGWLPQVTRLQRLPNGVHLLFKLSQGFELVSMFCSGISTGLRVLSKVPPSVFKCFRWLWIQGSRVSRRFSTVPLCFQLVFNGFPRVCSGSARLAQGLSGHL